MSVANDKKCVPDSSGRGGKGNRPQVLENGYLATKLTMMTVDIHHDKVVLVKEKDRRLLLLFYLLTTPLST